MKFGDLIGGGWSLERLHAEGWVHAAGSQDIAAAGFRLRSHEARVYMPGWLHDLDLYRWGIYSTRQRDRLPALRRIAERVREHGDEDLAAACALGGGKAVNDLLKAEGTL